MQASIRSRPSSVTGIRDDAAESTRDARDELTLKRPMLEAEALGLRQNLAEVTANRDELRKEMDDLRRDRDHWRKLAEQGEPKLAAAGTEDLVLWASLGGRLRSLTPRGAPTRISRRSGEEQESRVKASTRSPRDRVAIAACTRWATPAKADCTCVESGL